MSLDQVDDIEGAELLIERLAIAYELLITQPFVTLDLQLLEDVRNYCRPTCGYGARADADKDGVCDGGWPAETCGCPCHDDEQAEAANG